VFSISAPVLVPPGFANFRIQRGTLLARSNYTASPNTFMLQVGSDAKCQSTSGGKNNKNCNSNVGVQQMTIDGSNVAWGGLLIEATMNANVRYTVRCTHRVLPIVFTNVLYVALRLSRPSSPTLHDHTPYTPHHNVPIPSSPPSPPYTLNPHKPHTNPIYTPHSPTLPIPSPPALRVQVGPAIMVVGFEGVGISLAGSGAGYIHEAWLGQFQPGASTPRNQATATAVLLAGAQHDCDVQNVIVFR
jgi:hypothetical protein